MSTVFCSERDCIYQKDGLCNLNTVTAKAGTSTPSSSCLYFYSKQQALLITPDPDAETPERNP